MEMNWREKLNYILRPQLLTYLSTKRKENLLNLLKIVFRGYSWQLAKSKAKKHNERETAHDFHPNVKKKSQANRALELTTSLTSPLYPLQ